MISISHAPNATLKQRLQAAGLLCMPWRWLKGAATEKLESVFSADFDGEAVSFASGRQALYAVLKALGVGAGDEVILQAYTCIVVPHAVLWSGAKPIYADIDDSLNIDPQTIESFITPKTKAVIVQHTFGVPADLDRVMAICRKHNLLLIEDAAHALGARYRQRPVGTFGDAAIFSFGRDKIVSAVSGGMAVVKSPQAAKYLRRLKNTAPFPRKKTVAQNLLHPILVPVFSSLMGFWRIGSPLLRLAQRAGMLNKVYTTTELHSKKPGQLVERLPNAMAALALKQYQTEYPAFYAHRKDLANRYAAWTREHNVSFSTQKIYDQSEPSYLRYALLSEQSRRLVAEAARAKMLLGDWYAYPIVPKPSDDADLGYTYGSCPKAERAASQSLNLPTHIRFSRRQQNQLLTWLTQHLL